MESNKVKFKPILFWTLKAICASFLAIILLSAVVLIYSNTGIHIDNPLGFTDYKWNSAQFRSTMTEGFAWYRADKYGFNNENSDLYDKADILLMGSSHMEAFNISKDKNVAALLNKELEDQTYNVGMSGHNIYICAKNLEKAVDEFPGVETIIIETGTIELDNSIMQSVINGKLSKIPSYNKGLVYQLQKMPSLQVLYRQLDALLQPAPNENTKISDARDKNKIEDIGTEDEQYKQSLDKFLKFISDAGKGKNIIIFYHPSLSLSKEGTAYTNIDEKYVIAFSNASKANNITFLNLEETFITGYKTNHVLPHSFINTSVGSGHLNSFGHKMIADELVEHIAAIDQR